MKTPQWIKHLNELLLQEIVLATTKGETIPPHALYDAAKVIHFMTDYDWKLVGYSKFIEHEGDAGSVSFVIDQTGLSPMYWSNRRVHLYCVDDYLLRAVDPSMVHKLYEMRAVSDRELWRVCEWPLVNGEQAYGCGVNLIARALLRMNMEWEDQECQ